MRIYLFLQTTIYSLFMASSLAQPSQVHFDAWQTGYEKIPTWKFLSQPKNRDYQFKVSIDGQVTLSTGRYRPIVPAGNMAVKFSLPRDNRILAQLELICSSLYGTKLKAVDVRPKHKKLAGWDLYPSVVLASCMGANEFQLATAKEKERIERIQAEVEAARAEDKRMAEQRKVARADARRQRAAMILEERKEKCTSYGFIPNTDGHATCVMELAIADEANEQRQTYNAARATAIENQTAVAQAAADEARRQREAAADEARRQRQAQALINLGSAISSGGASGSSISTPTTAPLSSGRYKTCNYRVAGEIVPMTVGRAELCPATRAIGGRTGYLVR